MSEFVTILEHRGRKIVFFNCRGMAPDQVAALFPEVTRTALENRINLICTDVTGSAADDAVKAAAADSTRAIQEAMGAMHSALVGIKGLQRIIAQAIVKDQYFAKTLDEALDHLAAQA
jgi:hypothetical protein